MAGGRWQSDCVRASRRGVAAALAGSLARMCARPVLAAQHQAPPAASPLLLPATSAPMSSSGASSKCQGEQDPITPKRPRLSRGGPSSFELTMSSASDQLVDESIAKIIAHLRADHRKVLPTLQVVAGDALIPKDPSAVSMQSLAKAEKGYPPSYVKLGSLPKCNAASLLIEMEPKVFKDEQWVVRAERASRGMMHNCMWMALGCCALTKWPTAGHGREVFRQVVLRRYRELGSRLSHLEWSADKKGEPVVDWMKNGIFILGPSDREQKLYVKHRFGDEAPLDSCFVIMHGEYTMRENHLELQARLEAGKLSVNLASLFAPEVVASWPTKSANETMGHLAVVFAKEEAEKQRPEAQEENSGNDGTPPKAEAKVQAKEEAKDEQGDEPPPCAMAAAARVALPVQ